MQTISLLDLLSRFDAPKQIDFISIDTEGSELEIMKAFDFNAYTFNCICIEYGTEALRKGIFDLLSSHGYVRKWEDISAHDDWYVHSTKPASNIANIERLTQRIKKLPVPEMERRNNRLARKLAKFS